MFVQCTSKLTTKTVNNAKLSEHASCQSSFDTAAGLAHGMMRFWLSSRLLLVAKNHVPILSLISDVYKSPLEVDLYRRLVASIFIFTNTNSILC